MVNAGGMTDPLDACCERWRNVPPLTEGDLRRALLCERIGYITNGVDLLREWNGRLIAEIVRLREKVEEQELVVAGCEVRQAILRELLNAAMAYHPQWGRELWLACWLSASMNIIRQHLGHAPGCTFASGGYCTCGAASIILGLFSGHTDCADCIFGDC